MQGFLLDAHLPIAVVEGVRLACPACEIEHIAHWREGQLRQALDDEILAAARDASLMLVTYDVATIPTIIHGWLALGRSVPFACALIVTHSKSLPRIKAEGHESAGTSCGRLTWYIIKMTEPCSLSYMRSHSAELISAQVHRA